jgi:NADH-quinone oxidoreductase subunit L
MTVWLHLFLLIPLGAFLLSLMIPRKKESLISGLAFTTAGINLFTLMVFVACWIWQGFPLLNIRDLSVYKNREYDFFLDFNFDRVSAVFLLVGALLTFMISIYSKYYMHREEGYKRFFSTILFFFTGFNFTVLAGNFETLFIGWEMLGISSFLLIAFYRDRYLPVKNAVKVFSIYRIGDVGLLLAMWLSHHLWHENITFVKLNQYELVHHHLASHSMMGAVISLMILTAAVVKSAQLPFSSWLPRAMEGPTPSSAIFYGSLSVHMGAFLLMRTYPFWEHQLSIRILIGSVGLATALIASLIARVQSTVKSQIAYASISQIGIIFIEIAMGWEVLALIHFAGNAFLRTYQLLVSPSVVTYLIREQFFHFIPRSETMEGKIPKKLEYTLFLLSLKEWNLDTLVYRFLWRPLKRLGKLIPLYSLNRILIFFFPVYFSAVWIQLNRPEWIAADQLHLMPSVITFIGLILVLKAFAERKNPWLAWVLVLLNHLLVALAITYNEHFDWSHQAFYLSGIIISFFTGSWVLGRLKQKNISFDLNTYQGNVHSQPTLALIFLLSCLGMAGFPITPTFIGEDLIFSHIHQDQILLALFVSLSFVLNGIALIRMYARIFLGIHSIKNHPKPYYNS